MRFSWWAPVGALGGRAAPRRFEYRIGGWAKTGVQQVETGKADRPKADPLRRGVKVPFTKRRQGRESGMEGLICP